MLKTATRALLIAAVLLAAGGCSYDTSTTFNPDGTVAVGLQFLFPKSLLDQSSGANVHGMSPADVTAAQAKLQAQYPGAKVTIVTDGDEKGVKMTIPFKTEKEAFAFLTQPSKLKPPSGTATSTPSINLSDTGGVFASASHTSNGTADVYTFKTRPVVMPSPSPAQQQFLSADELSSVFTVTFALTVPHVITSAPGALFTEDRKTAIWTLTWSQAQTLTATTGSDTNLTGFASAGGQGQSPVLLIVVAFVAVSAGFLLGMFQPWRRLRPQPTPPPPQ